MELNRRVCDKQVVCPTSDNEMNAIRERLDSGGKKMDEIHAGIRKNRRYDIAILLLGIVSLFANLYLNGGQ